VHGVLEDGMEGKVGEGRKEGNGNHLTAFDIYNHQIQLEKRISNERRNVVVGDRKKFVFG